MGHDVGTTVELKVADRAMRGVDALVEPAPGAVTNAIVAPKLFIRTASICALWAPQDRRGINHRCTEGHWNNLRPAITA